MDPTNDPTDPSNTGCRVTGCDANTQSPASPADAEAPAPTEGEAWVAGYKRRMLDHLGAEDDVDLDTVQINSGYKEAWAYSEYTGGDAAFSVEVTWLQKTAPDKWSKPNSDGLYEHRRELTNEEVAAWLSSLEIPE